jgi:hypothetical protein
VVTPNQSSIEPGQQGSFTVTTTTADNNPAPGVSGTVSLASGDAQILNSVFTTDSNGKATINVVAGQNPGDIAINVTCGALQTSSVIKVAAPVIIPKPPDTGNGGGAEPLPWAWIVFGISGMAAAGASAFAVASRRR